MSPRKLIALAVVGLSLCPALFADVVKNEDGTYTVDGTFTFWADRDMLAPSGKNNSFGEFQTVLFKSAVNDFEGIREMKQTYAAFVVRAREGTTPDGGSKNLVVEEILRRAE